MSSCEDDLLVSARFTNRYIRLVGQTPAPSKCVLLSTSRIVRRRVKDWVLSDSGDRWSVKLDVPDLGGHLDTTLRHRASTLTGRVSGLLGAVLVVMALPLGFPGKLRILRTKFLPSSLHAIEASSIPFTLLHKLRTAFVSAVWSEKMPLAHVGAVLTLLDGPPGCDPGFYIVWCRFRLFRRYLAYRPHEVPRLFNLIGLVAAGGPGFWSFALAGGKCSCSWFTWDPLSSGWVRPGLPPLHQMAGPYQHYQAAIWEAWQAKVSFDPCRRQGFRGGPLLDIAGSLQLLHSPHVRERDKALLRAVMVGGSGMDFFSVMPGEKSFRAASAVSSMGMGIFFGNVHTPLWFKFVKILTITIWPRGIKVIGLCVCSGMAGCLPLIAMEIGLLGLEGQLLGFLRLALVITLHTCLKHGLIRRSSNLEQLRANLMLIRMFGQTVVWFVMSFLVSAVGGRGFLLLFLERAWFRRSWGRLELLPPVAEVGDECCRLSLSPYLVMSSRFRELSFGELSWLYSLLDRCI